MKGLLLDLRTPGNVKLDLSQSVEGRQALAQNMVVNILNIKGSDAAYSEKGTDLFKAGLHNLFIDLNQAQHFANFAGVDTLFFTRSTDYVNQEALAIFKVELKPRIVTPQRIIFTVGFTFEGGVETTENIALK